MNLRGNLHDCHLCIWGRDNFAVFTHYLDVHLNGLGNVLLDFLDRFTRRDTSIKIWNPRTIIIRRALNNDCVLNHRILRSNPACLIMLPRSSRCRSSPISPDTVTVPGFVGW